MELYQLRSFQEIVGTRNLTRAAEQLNISQSALSSQIRLLEEELGVPLFHRSARGMELTGQGRILCSYAEDVLRAAAIMQEKADEMNGRSYGTCRIGLNTDGGFLKVSRLSRALAQSLPEVNVVFVSSQTIRTPEMLRQGLIDIGFFFGDCQDSGIETVMVSTFRIAIVIPEALMAKGQEINWPKAATLPWIWSVCDCPYYQVVQEQFDSLGLKPRKVVDAMDESVVRELVSDGQGVAILREDEAETLASQAAVWIWDDIRFTLPLRLGWLKQRRDNALLCEVEKTVLSIWQQK